MPRTIPAVLWCACLLMSGFAPQSAAAGEPGREELTAKKLLARMSWEYANCKSYRDSGVLETAAIGADGSRTVVKKPFSTAFVRPDRFRFEHFSGPDHYLIWSEGRKVQRLAQSWDGAPRVRTLDSLGDAVEASLGVGRSPVFSVPVLLLPGTFKMRPLTALARMERIADAKLGKEDCFRVAGDYLDSPVVIWIDKKTFLIRRIDSSLKGKDSRADDTTTYEPAMDRNIPDKLLRFETPK
ncbi:MAG: hypothetical protein PHS14_13345 [Elusimicrobia bacterium]|nr:hypothetical protein [Elusimicrobiota bacterium]